MTLFSCFSHFQFIYVQLLDDSGVVQMKWVRHRSVTLGCNRHRLHYSLVLAMSALIAVSWSSKWIALWPRHNRGIASTDPCARPFFCRSSGVGSVTNVETKRRYSIKSSMTLTNSCAPQIAIVCGSQIPKDNDCLL